MGKKIIIFNSYSYYGGTLVLSVLCKTLRELGYDARLYMTLNFISEPHDIRKDWKRIVFFNLKKGIKRFLYKIFPLYKKYDRHKLPKVSSVSMSGLKFQWLPIFSTRNTIVIYPEVVYGNPLFSKNVVRWLLFHYKFENSQGAYKKDDLFIAYRSIFNSKSLNPQDNVVNIRYFDNNLYKQYNFGERKDKCYIIRKGKFRSDLPKEFDGPVYNNNMSEEELVKLFNEYKYCYSYDTQTFYTVIAAVCGCIPIIVMEAGKSISDYLGPDDEHLGQAYGDSAEQIQYAIDTRDQLLASLNFEEHNRRNAKNLVSILEKQYGSLKLR